MIPTHSLLQQIGTENLPLWGMILVDAGSQGSVMYSSDPPKFIGTWRCSKQKGTTSAICPMSSRGDSALRISGDAKITSVKAIREEFTEKVTLEMDLGR